MRFSGLAIAMAFAVTACSKEKTEAPVMAAEPAPAPAAAPTAINVSSVEVVDMPDLSAVKAKYGVTPELQACHTAVVGNYTVEGHVPADLIVKMLNEKPAIAGIAVPGMPSGSPGMEGGAKEAYDVIAFDKDGKTSVYAHR